jgi:hypothetical protein
MIYGESFFSPPPYKTVDGYCLMQFFLPVQEGSCGEAVTPKDS